MKVLVYVNFNNHTIGGVYRSVFSRVEQLKKSKEIESVEIISVQEDYRGILKLISKKRGYKNYFNEDEIGFWNETSYCSYIKIRTNINNKIFERINPKYFVDRRYKEVINSKKILDKDLIIVHSSFPDSYVAKLISEKYKIPYILTFHGSDINVYSQKNEKIKKLSVESFENSNKCIFVSNRLLQEAKSFGYSGKNAVVVPNGYDENKFKVMDKEKIREELNVKRKNIGFIGNLIYIKGVDRLPDIFMEIYKLYKNVEFTVIGDGNYREVIEKKISQNNLPVKFLGKLDKEDIPKHLNSMDVLVLPSRNEGWPCVVVEAIACNVPVVGSNKGGIAEAIGTCGEVVEEDDFIKEFSQSVLKVINNSEVYIENCNKYKNRYTWGELCKKELNVIGDLNCEYSIK